MSEESLKAVLETASGKDSEVLESALEVGRGIKESYQDEQMGSQVEGLFLSEVTNPSLLCHLDVAYTKLLGTTFLEKEIERRNAERLFLLTPEVAEAGNSYALGVIRLARNGEEEREANLYSLYRQKNVIQNFKHYFSNVKQGEYFQKTK